MAEGSFLCSEGTARHILTLMVVGLEELFRICASHSHRAGMSAGFGAAEKRSHVHFPNEVPMTTAKEGYVVLSIPNSLSPTSELQFWLC